MAVESTSNAWDFYNQVAPLVAQVLVANPRLVKLIAGGRVKTDKIDTLALAKLIATGFLPTVWVPPLEVREARGLLAHRARLVQQRTRLRNRLQSVLERHNLPAPEGELFSVANRTFWETLPVCPLPSSSAFGKTGPLCRTRRGNSPNSPPKSPASALRLLGPRR